MELFAWKGFFILAVLAVVARAASLKKSRKTREASYGNMYLSSSRSRPYHIQLGCERTEMELSCKEDERIDGSDRVIYIVRASYGRQHQDPCRMPAYTNSLFRPCVAPTKRSTRTVSRRCNGKSKCRLPVVNELFGDPCPDTYKYLEVYFVCIPN